KLLESALENDSLLDFKQINLAFVRPKKTTDRSLAYAQGHWMYQYMIERWGERAPLDLMDRYAAGQREDAAFQAVLGMGTVQFLEEFRGWAAKQVASWGMGQREGEPTLAQILLEEAASTEKGREVVTSQLQAAAGNAAWSAIAGGGEESDWTPD